MRLLARVVPSTLLALLALFVPGPAHAAAPANQILQQTVTTSCGTFTGCASGSVLNTTLSPPTLVSIQVSGSFTGTLQFEGSLDCVIYSPIPLVPAAGGGAVSQVSAAGIWSSLITAPTCFQVRATAWTGGTATITMLTGMQASALSTTTTGGSTGAITSPLDTSGFVAVHEQSTAQVSGAVQVTQAVGNSLHMVCDTGCLGVSPWQPYVVPATTACVSPAVCIIKASTATLAAIINESTAAQPAGVCTLYDSSTAASGTVLYTENGMGAGQVISFTADGIKTTNGLAIQCAATPGGSGLLVVYL